jgi:hypothetical protein
VREHDDGPREKGPALSTAEASECACPDYCERDHANE